MSRGMWSDDQFAGLPTMSVIAHELKSPILLMRQLGLLLQDDTLSGEERQLYQEQLVSIADRSLHLTNDLAQSANLQPSLFPLSPVNPLAACRMIADELRPMTRLYRRDVVWPKSSTRHAPLVVANMTLLGRIVANFVDNALKYTEPSVPVRVRVWQAQGRVRIGVRDYGPRLSRTEYSRLVDEMESMKTVKTRPESSGLGVFVSSQFARAMDGEIGLTRHRDGVTFFVELPVSRQMSLV